MRVGAFSTTHLLGSGAAGRVWAVDSELPLAAKVLHSGDLQALAVEVRAVARLHHPGVVGIYDQGGDQTAPWILMERGDSTLKEAPPAGWPEVRDLLRQLLAGLAHAHARGVVHRDVKASNVLRFDQPGGSVRWALTDFGIAHLVGTRRTGVRHAGTPHAMAPEQFEGRWSDFGPPTDLYAVGCLAWWVLTGSPPFPSTDPRALAAAHRTAPLPALAACHEVPSGMEGWLHGLLAKAREDRFQRAADAAWALEALGGAGPGAPQANVGASTRDDDETVDVSVELDRVPVPRPAARERPSARPPASLDEALRAAPARTMPPEARGTSLVGLREAPTVGRLAERRLLWERLLEVRHGVGRVVEIRGDRGTGRHHLARWLATRAEALGTAAAIQAGGRLDAIARAALRAEGIDGDALERHLAGELRRHGLDRPSRITLAGLLGVGITPRRPDARAALVRLLASLAAERGLVVVLDGPDRSLQPVLRATRDHPILWLLVEPDGIEGEVIELQPLASGARARALSTVLPVDDQLAVELLDRSGGDLSHARRLLRRWADDGRLEATPRGYRRRAGVELPGVSSAFRVVGHAHAEAAALAALLGAEVDRAVWLDACAPLPATEVLRVEDALVAAGAIRLTGEGFAWVRPEVREVLRPPDAAHGLHLRLADALARRAPTPRLLGEQGRHLARAGRSEEADDKLLQGAARAHEEGALYDAMALLELVSDPDRSEVQWRRALALTMLGDLDAGEAAARCALDLACTGRDRGAALRALGAVAVRRGDRRTAHRWLAAALEVVDLPADQRDYATVEHASNLMYLGRIDEARQLLQREVTTNAAAAVSLLVVQGRALLELEELGRAEAVMRRGLAAAAELGSRTWLGILQVDLALVLRRTGHLESARSGYLEAIEHFEAVDNPPAAATALLGLGGLEALEGDAEVALTTLDAARGAVAAAGNDRMASAAQVGTLPALARLGLWGRFDEAITAARDPLPPSLPFVREVLEAAERAARSANEPSRAAAAAALRTAIRRESTP